MHKEMIRTVLQGIKSGAIERNFGLNLLRQLPELAKADQRIAVIGLSCRFPRASSKEAFWENLRDGRDCVGPFPKERRADVDRYLGVFDDRHFIGSDPYFHGGYLDDVDRFDNEVFNMLPGESLYVSPEQRLFLETALEAFEDAGYGQDALQRSATGVYVGNSGNQYGYLVEEPIPSSVAGNLSAFIASRVSYVFGLSGPSMMVSVGCSSSLLAVHLACQALLNGDCEMALAGGITLDLFPSNTTDHIWNMLGIAKSGARCRAFDDSADGIAKGEGSGAVVLKPLARALEDGDAIYAVLLASGANQDGRSNGITAPNPVAQAELLEHTWRKAGIDPRTLGYIEAHGTGTHLGDPIELKGLEWAFRRFTADQRFCPIGSVKTNIGHLADGAAGIAGLIKTILALRARQIPPSLHFHTPNRNVDFEALPVYVNTELRPWPSGGAPRRAGVSAFGLCGTNVHVVVQEWESKDENGAPRAAEPQLFVLSAKSDAALLHTAKKHLAFYEGAGGASNLHDVCRTLSRGRAHHEHRLALVVRSMDDLRRCMARVIGEWDVARAHTLESDATDLRGESAGVLDELRRRYLAGEPLDWSTIHPGAGYRKVHLPSYGFNRRRFWLEASRLTSPMLGNLHAAVRGESDTAPSARRSPYDAPAAIGDAELRELWRECLGVDTFSEAESLYRIGGDSLIAVQIATKLEQRYGVSIDLYEFFEASSFGEFSALVRRVAEAGRGHGARHDAVATSGEAEPEAIREPADGALERRLPMTSAQHRLWVMDQLEAKRIAYLVQGIFQVRGDLEPARLVTAIERTAQAHDVFRHEMGYDHEPFQRLRSDVAIHVEQLALDGTQDAVTTALNLARRRCQTPIPLDRPPLCRFQLASVGPQHWVFSYQIHHIIFDGWSHDLFFKEVRRRYLDSSGADPLESSRSRATYAAFVQEQLGSALTQSAGEQYWLAKLGDELPKTFIAGDKPRPVAFSFQGRTERVFFEDRELAKLKTFCQQEDVTLFTLLMAVLDVLIQARTGQTDLLVGSPVHGRQDARFHDTVGLFTNTVVLRQQVGPEMPFRGLLRGVREDAQRSILHQGYPFDRLVEKLGVKKDPAYSPLFNINLAVQNARSRDKQDLELPGVTLQWEPTDAASCKWDLAFDFVEYGAGLQLNLEYCTDLYSPEFIGELVQDYRSILERVLANPEVAIGQLGAKRLHESHGSAVLSRWRRIVDTAAARPAVQQDDVALTYAELDLLSLRISGLLLARHAGERVGILCTHGAAAVATILGTLQSGRTYVPLDPESPLERLKAIVEGAQIATVVYTSNCIDTANRLQWECPVVGLTLCCDADDVSALQDQRQNGLSESQLWDYVGSKAADDIQGGGWVSSYTGQPFSREEMDEYADNVWRKVSPLIHERARVLEIGCSSGITMFRIAPACGEYVAIDLSAVLIDANRRRAEREGLAAKIRLYQMQASDVQSLAERDFDLVIINSVVHCFSGYQYLERVIEQVISKCAPAAHVFVGDLMDADCKKELERSLLEFKSEHGDTCPTKLYWDSELFVPERYFRHLRARFPQLQSVARSGKIHSIPNELTRFRYDVLMRVDKAGKVAVAAGERLRFDASDVATSAPRAAPSVSGQSLAYVLHTSGSTGTPKGVGITHDNLANYLDWACREYFDDAPGDMAMFTPLTFDFTVTSLFCPLLTGGAVHLFPGPFRENAARMFTREGLTKAKLTPSHLAYLLEAGCDLTQFDMFILGGEALERRLLQRLAAAHRGHFVVYNEYGPTEATVGCIVEKLTRDQLEGSAPVKIGKPISGMSAAVVDARLEPVPVGEKGEILLQGASVAPGYLDGARADKFIELPGGRGRAYLTGDVGFIDRDGDFVYAGRKDDQLKILGHRVDPAEVAEALDAVPGVVRAHVLGIRDANGDMTLSAFMQIDRPLKARDIRARLARVLPAYMLPTVFRRVERFPCNANGKVDKQALLAAAAELDTAPAQGATEELTPRERCFIDVVQGVLRDRTSQLALDSSFADLGGDSIRAIMLVNALRKNGFGVQVSEVFELGSVRELMRAVASRTSMIRKEAPEVVGPFDLLPLQRRFFRTFPTQAEWFNNSVLLAAPGRLDRESIERALHVLTRRHALLRAVFLPSPNGVFKGEVLPEGEAKREVAVHDVLDEEASVAVCNRLQRGFDLSRGPLFSISLLRGRDFDSLYIVAHHLVIDRISWQIVVEELVQLTNDPNADPGQPRPLTSFGAWSAAANAFFAAPERRQSEFWRQRFEGADTRWFGQPSRVRDLALATSRLDRTRSRDLAQASRSMPGGLEVFCASAVANALTALLGGENPLIMFESHGRHPEQIGAEMDLAQTVGWFTAPYPVELNAGPRRALDQNMLAENAERVRASKNRCLSFGYFREGLGQSERGCRVGFNYMGDVRGVAGTSFQLVERRDVQVKSPEGTTEHQLFIAAAMTDEGLVFDVEYDAARHDVNWVNQLMERITVEIAGAFERVVRGGEPVQGRAPRMGDPRPKQDSDNVVALTPSHPELDTLFMLHGAGGEVFQYGVVAKQLAGRLNIMGIQAHGIFEECTLPRSRDELAERYADAVAAACPSGPLSFAGYSLSAFIGYDLIGALQRRGRSVERFILIDNPIADIARDQETIRRRTRVIVAQALRLLLQLDDDPGSDRPVAQMISDVFAELKASSRPTRGFDEAFFHRYARVVSGLYECVMTWQPDGVRQTALHYIGASARENESAHLGGWGQWFAGAKTQSAIACGHTEFFKEAHADSTSRAILRAFERTP